MDKFIYTFTLESKEGLISQGYRLLQEMDDKNMAVFENSPNIHFDLNDKTKYMVSNTLLF